MSELLEQEGWRSQPLTLCLELGALGPSGTMHMALPILGSALQLEATLA